VSDPLAHLDEAKRTRIRAAASRMLADPAVLEAKAQLEEQWIRRWRTSPVGEKDAREDAYLALSGLTELFQLLQKFADGGTLSSRKLRSRPGG